MSANADAIGMPVGDLETPALCLDLEAYRRNVRRMADYIIQKHGLAWRPHMKGQKAPELAREAVAAGAAGVTCATLYEAEAMVDAGVENVLLANQVAGPRKLARLARLARRARVIAATDSVEHAAQLNAAALAEGAVVPVLVEVDVGMKRCGVAPGAPAAQLAECIHQMRGLRFLGVMGWEGHAVPLEGDRKRLEIAACIERLADSAEACRAAGLTVEIVSASGSATYLLSAPRPGLTEVQAGGGAFCDLNYQRWGLDHEFALTVLTRIVSRPTEHRIIVDGGFKTMSVQHGQPRPTGLGALKSMVLTAEHGILELEEADCTHKVGDTVLFIPGYTDSTVCLHDELCVIRNGALEAVWAIPGRTGRALRPRTMGSILLVHRLGKSPRYKWLLVLALFFVSALNYADRTAITALYTLLKTDLGFTDVGLGALGSVFLWSYAFSSPFSGFLGDRVRRGRLVLWSLVGWSLVTLVSGVLAAQWQLLGMRCALGLVEAMYLPAAMALVAEYHGTETRGTALALMALGNYVGMAGGGAVAGYLGEHYGWRVPLIVLGAAGLVLAAICRFVLPAGLVAGSPEREASPLSFPAAATALLRIPSFLVVAGAGVLTAIGTWIFINWLPLYFRENMGMTLAGAGFFGSSLVSLSGAAGQVVGGVVSDRVAARAGPHRRMWLQAVLILCAAPMLLAFVLTRSLTLIMTALVVYSLLRTSADLNMLPLLCDLAGVHKRSIAFGFTNMVNTLAGGLGVFVAGYLKSGFGLDGVFAGVAGILALDAVLLFTGYYFLLRKDLRASGAIQ